MRKRAQSDLKRYIAKRNFSKTSEPRGVRAKGKGNRYLIQKHAASHLHYDFRLELDGVLKSWAVPKGPSYDPADKRLAMEVEDHPVAYGSFEGTIPKGEYGGGTVMLWDEGTWEPVGDPHEGLRKGKLVFKVLGKKIKGEWTLVKTFRGEKGDNKWLLIKHRDAYIKPGGGDAFLEKNNRSVVSRRSMDQIAADPGRRQKTISSGAADQKVTAKAKERVVAVKASPTASKKRGSPHSPSDGKIEVGGVTISHASRIIYPEDKISKGDLASYYLSVANHILPYVADRPLSILRCPEGTGSECFFQRHLGLVKSDAIHEVKVKIKGTSRPYIQIKDARGLLSLVQWGVIELHPWECASKDLDHPDRLIFDLDPDPSVRMKDLVEGAFEVRERLEAIGLRSYLKTTGGKGLHVVVPLAPLYDWSTVKSFTRGIAEAMVAERPDRYIAQMSKVARKGKIFIDYLRNDATSTAVAPFSARARKGATVSIPLAWDELSPTLKLNAFTVANVSSRLAKQKRDPWRDFGKDRQKIGAKLLRLLSA